jgi:hypothetical protein
VEYRELSPQFTTRPVSFHGQEDGSPAQSTPWRSVCEPAGEASLMITQTVLGVDLSVTAAWLPRRMEGFLIFGHFFTAMALGCVVCCAYVLLPIAPAC